MRQRLARKGASSKLRSRSGALRVADLCVDGLISKPALPAQRSVRLACSFRYGCSMFYANTIDLMAGATFGESGAVHFVARAALHEFASQTETLCGLGLVKSVWRLHGASFAKRKRPLCGLWAVGIALSFQITLAASFSCTTQSERWVPCRDSLFYLCSNVQLLARPNCAWWFMRQKIGIF